MSEFESSHYAIWKDFLKNHSKDSFEKIYSGFKRIYSDNSIPVIWETEQYPIHSNVKNWMDALGFSYPEFYNWSISHRELFWEHIINAIPLKFNTPYSSILKPASNPDELIWLPDARFNIIESCFFADPKQPAIYFKSESSQNIQSICYEALYLRVQQLATGFKLKGYVEKDRIILYTPFSIDAIASYLALIYIGAEPVLIADSFSSVELTKRMEIIHAKAIITVNSYIYADKKIDVLSKVLAAQPESIILIDSEITSALSIRNNTKDILLSELINKNNELVRPYYHLSTDTISILFSSGTTKEPKAIPWKATTPIKCAADGKLLQDIQEKDIITWTSGMGWMMAPWLIFAGLINKASIAIYNGAYSKKEFIDFTIQTKVTLLGTIPSVVKSWKSQQFGKIPNWNIRVFSSTGEPSDMEDYVYLSYMNDFKAPIIEYCGGTEIGGGYLSSVVELPNAPCYFNTATPGTEFILLNNQLEVVTDKGAGEVFIIPPTIGLSQELLNKSHFEEYYLNAPTRKSYPNLRKHGDGFTISTLESVHFYKSIGRTDDTMNLGGIKISSIEIESVLNKHEDVIESAAISVQNKTGGPEKLVVFIHPIKKEIQLDLLQAALQKLIQKELNPLFKISEIRIKESFPRTASNKLIRKDLRKEYLA